MIYHSILNAIGSTPVVRLESDHHLDIYAKLEYYNPMGSIKDRAAKNILQRLLSNGEIDCNTMIIESSSGNYGVALAAYCRNAGLKFTCVIDPNIMPINEYLIRSLGANIIKVDTPDENGGYLMSRLQYVRDYIKDHPNTYWINQYSNPYNAQAYYETIGEEICQDFDRLDYVFMGVSSGGTITGISKRLKEQYPQIKVVAVDIEGSVVFGGPARKRRIPGIGSSMRPDILRQAYIDDVVVVSETETKEACLKMLEQYHVFAGGSSGSVYGAIKKYFSDKPQICQQNVLGVFADSGNRYTGIIYGDEFNNYMQI